MTDVPRQAPGWRDDPITRADQDRFGRLQFAEHAARLIHRNHSPTSSVVYGLEGPWGSGKSSLISLVRMSLVEVEDSRWHFIPFTPWATSGTDGLLQEFFAALRTVAPPAGSQRLVASINAYAGIARPVLAAIPGVGPAIVEASRTAEQQLRKPWNVAFEEVKKAIGDLGTPIVMVVDDIDRLQPAELLDLLKVVRLLGRFPGVDFLLAYDEQTLVDTLQDPSRGRVSASRARAFMEKIVQYPLVMPPLLTGKIVSMIAEGLSAILGPQRVDHFEAQRFSSTLTKTMPSQLKTPRAIERFLAQVELQFGMHDPFEINDVDLILATFIRVQFPDVFARLQRWKSELTNSSVSFGRRDAAGPDWNELLDVLDEKQDKKDALETLSRIFPVVTSKGSGRAATGRFAHPDYFDRYLAQAIPEDDIPDASIESALRSAAHQNDGSVLKAFLMSSDEERVTLALSKIRACYPDAEQEVNSPDQHSAPLTPQLIAQGMAILAEMPERIVSWSSGLSLATYWMASAIRLLLVRDPGAELDASLLACDHLRRRAQVISSSVKDLDSLPAETQAALSGLLKREAERVIPAMLQDLRDGDEGNEELGFISLALMAREAGVLHLLQDGIRDGLAANQFSLADVAARFVGFSYLVGGPPEPSSASFAGELFQEITALDAQSRDMDERGLWTDTSWPRRKEFAARWVPVLGSSGSGEPPQC